CKFTNFPQQFQSIVHVIRTLLVAASNAHFLHKGCLQGLHLPPVCSGPTDFCTLPPDPGHCSGHHLQYFYDPNNRNCETFMFSGCGGNENRFKTLKKCLWYCRNPATRCCGEVW
uniref:BPTI/Kunitz inhibitor domain-containing protein n=1 Tax=Anolis carolinensis TaxID=28377 RepID=A0A803TMW5_ANOCA